LIAARRFSVTFGDVLGAVALLGGICITAWTTLVLFSLLFPARTSQAAGRVQEHEPRLSPYAALMRGAALVVVPGLLPVFGWFIIAPAMLFVGVGAGTKALHIVPPVQG
jgi:hypothetical protein